MSTRIRYGPKVCAQEFGYVLVGKSLFEEIAGRAPLAYAVHVDLREAVFRTRTGREQVHTLVVKNAEEEQEFLLRASIPAVPFSREERPQERFAL